MKKELNLILIFILLIGIIGIITAINSNDSKKIDSKILKEFEKGNNKVRVIIDINEKDNKGIFSYFSKKPETRDELINSISKEKIKHKLSNTSFSAELTENEIESLADKGYSVGYIPKVKLLLQDSTEEVNSTETWLLKKDNLNLTGEKQTICVIDTGINYTHSDLGGCYGENNPNFDCKVLGGKDITDNDDNPIDGHGHGTHVAGIAAANGNLKGVSPSSKLVALKVFDDSGSSGSLDDVKVAIDWCVDNASEFNISVITLSLGVTNQDGEEIPYDDYCDGDYDGSGSPISPSVNLVSSINNAVSKNISVTISSGNNLGSGNITAPACIQNATPIGASTYDSSSLIFNRNWMVKLLGIGTQVNSTWNDGSYELAEGTSMSAPHVAGAIAIINQYLKLTSQTKTPLEIESILNNTGKQINDSSGSKLNYSRIDVYNSIISLDESNPNINLISPLNNSFSSDTNQTFSCNASDLSLKNTTLYIWNSTGIYNTSSELISGDSYSFEKNINNIPYGTYSWNCLFYDENNNFALASNNNTLTIDSINVNLVSPQNNLITNSNQTYTCNASSLNNLTNVTFKIWNSTNILQYNLTKEISGKSNESVFSYDFLKEDNYSWNCFFKDNTSTENFNENNFSITYDLSSPILRINSPDNNSWISKDNFNITLNENGSCVFSLNNNANQSMNTTDNRTFYYTNNSLNSTDTSSDYNITYYCNDTAGNSNSSSLIYFGIEKTKPIIKLLSPENDYSQTTSSKTFNFIFNVSDNLNISSCELIINGTSNSVTQNTSIINKSENNSISKTLSSGTYSWKINCTDSAGNENSSKYRNIILNTPPSTSSSSSGGGGGGISNPDDDTPDCDNESYDESTCEWSACINGQKSARCINDCNETIIVYKKCEDDIMKQTKSFSKIIYLNSSELEKGKNYNLKENEKIKFNLSGPHSLKINNISKNSSSLTIRSNEINLTLFIGQEKNINLTSKNYYDLYLRLNNISNNSANFTLKEINKKIIKLPNINNNLFIYLTLVIIIIILLISVLYYLIKKNEKKTYS